MKIQDEFSHITCKAKRLRARRKKKGLCTRCGKFPVKIYSSCSKCRKEAAEYEETYRRGPRKSLTCRILKLEHDMYELKLLLGIWRTK